MALWKTTGPAVWENKTAGGSWEGLAGLRMPSPLDQSHLVVNCLCFCNFPPLFNLFKNLCTHTHTHTHTHPLASSGPRAALLNSDPRLYINSSHRQRALWGWFPWKRKAARHGVKTTTATLHSRTDFLAVWPSEGLGVFCFLFLNILVLSYMKIITLPANLLRAFHVLGTLLSSYSNLRR